MDGEASRYMCMRSVYKEGDASETGHSREGIVLSTHRLGEFILHTPQLGIPIHPSYDSIERR